MSSGHGAHTRLAADPAGRFLGHHQRRAVGVAAGDGRHRAGIDDAQRLDAAHPQLSIEHGHRVGYFLSFESVRIGHLRDWR